MNHKEKDNTIAHLTDESQNKKDIKMDLLLEKHQQMMNNADIEMDLTIFINSNGNNEFDKCESENCISLKRLLTASAYYDKLDIVKNHKHHELFNDFIHNIYVELINDYIHFNNQHSHAIETINNGLPE
eukprot:220498_1